MRIYIPLVAADLSGVISPRTVHAVTARLRSAVPGEDAEGLEMIATLAAADDSLRLLARAGGTRRLVAVAEVPGQLADAPDLETAVRLENEVSWDQVETILVDEPGHDELVARAIGGDDKAFEASADIDLLWYDVIERHSLAATL